MQHWWVLLTVAVVENLVTSPQVVTLTQLLVLSAGLTAAASVLIFAVAAVVRLFPG